jgi:hypothetical protein
MICELLTETGIVVDLSTVLNDDGDRADHPSLSSGTRIVPQVVQPRDPAG